MSQKHHLLVIDDEENIGKAIKNALKDKFNIHICLDQNSWQSYFSKSIDLILLDIWMPGKDGFTILKEIRELNTDTPIIIMSGHANIATSVEMLKKGASDFIEKPFQIDQLIQKIAILLNQEEKYKHFSEINTSKFIHEIDEKQKTIASSTVLTGKGLHKGKNTGIILLPAPANTGIIFEDIASEQRLEAHIDNLVEANFYATTLRKKNFSLTVVEHLLSVLHMYGVDNLHIKVSEEIPIFDGSAIAFCRTIDKVGLVTQDSPKKILKINQEYIFHDQENSDIWIKFIPYDGLSISYTLNFPEQFGEQKYDIDFKNNPKETFIKEIAPCRTFGFLDEIKQLYDHGLAQGTDLKTGILIDKGQVINTELLYPNEFARHKILDIIGDLYLCGCTFHGRVIGHYSGHHHTTQLQKQILNQSC